MAKHGVSFDEAKSVFFDEHARIIDDPDHSVREERFIVIGMSILAKVIVVCHCLRDHEHVIRIISARRATQRETNFYIGE
jgi:uncharacterized protein